MTKKDNLKDLFCLLGAIVFVSFALLLSYGVINIKNGTEINNNKTINAKTDTSKKENYVTIKRTNVYENKLTDRRIAADKQITKVIREEIVKLKVDFEKNVASYERTFISDGKQYVTISFIHKNKMLVKHKKDKCFEIKPPNTSYPDNKILNSISKNELWENIINPVELSGEQNKITSDFKYDDKGRISSIKSRSINQSKVEIKHNPKSVYKETSSDIRTIAHKITYTKPNIVMPNKNMICEEWSF